MKLISWSVFIMFMFFLLVNYFANNRLFYVRAILSFIVVFYILLADFFSSYSKKAIFKIMLFILVFFQLSQFLIYFMQDYQPFKNYARFDYVKHPIASFNDFAFLDNSCLITVPYWNYLSANYFLGKKTNVIMINNSFENFQNKSKYCDHIYVLDQTSIERYRFQYFYDSLNQAGYQPKLLEKNYNQEIFFLEEK